MFCPNCGKDNNDNVKYCKFCGKEIVDKKEDGIHMEEENNAAPPIKVYVVVGALLLLLVFVIIIASKKGDDSSDKDTKQEEKIESQKDNSQPDEKNKENEKPDEGDVVVFQDPLVERCVRTTLGKRYDEKITTNDCASITKLLIDCDLDMGITFSRTSLDGSVANYIDLCDLQYFTELEELIIDNNIDRDMLVNLDAIKYCTNLRRLSMEDNHGLYVSQMPQVGYKYLADIVQALPRLEYIDLGYIVPQEYKELIAGNNQKLVFEDTVSWLDANKGIQTNWVSSESEISTYVNAWTYGYNREETICSVLNASGWEELEKLVNALPTETEDVYVRYDGRDTIDMSIFVRFKNLKTLTIGNPSIFYMDDYSEQAVNVENIEKLVNNKELFSLNLCGVICDFNELKGLTQLKELTIYTSIINSLDFLPDLSDLRELTLLYNVMPNTEGFFDKYGSEFSRLRFLRIEDSSTAIYDGIYCIPNLETLSILDRVGVVYSFGAISQCKTLENLQLFNREEYNLGLEELAGLDSLKFLMVHNTQDVDNVSGLDEILALPSLVSVSVVASIGNTYYENLNVWSNLATRNPKISFLVIGGYISEMLMYHVQNGDWTLRECMGNYIDYYYNLYAAGISCGGYDYLMLRYPERYSDGADIMTELNY